MKHTILNVTPRYSPGSPAPVDRETFERVARSERCLFADALAGRYGAEQQQLAETVGLRGICIEMWEERGRWQIEDALTGQRWAERPLRDVPIGGSFFLYTGHAGRDLGRIAPARRTAERAFEDGLGRLEFVRDPKHWPTLVQVAQREPAIL